MKISEPINLEFTRENALRLLALGATPDDSTYSHKQIAEWCDRFWCQYLEVDAPVEIESLLPVLTSVETQWDLYLVNTYSLKELEEGDFEEVRLPAEWFSQWLEEANA
ncbi:hypothetical protein K2227_08705 [Shewanella putrefaciens]|nr:hypothetical protein K2227_08705 [Shewanella putrefaciens]